MTEGQAATLLEEVRENRKYIFEIVQRLTRVEERTSRKATTWGLVGGCIAMVPPVVWWVMTL